MTNEMPSPETLRERLESDYRTAMKARDQLTVSTIRMVKAAMQEAQVAKRGPLDDDETIAVVMRQARMRREAMSEFERGGRPDLAAQEANELEVLERYLPSQLSDDEITRFVDVAIAEANPADVNSNAAAGQVMRLVMPRVKGRAEGSRVNAIVRAALAARMGS